MRYVKIKAKNYNEAMMKLKMEHGDDAIPISHKYVKEGGLFNSKLLAKELVELTAAIPEKKPIPRARPEKKSTIDFTVGDTDVQKIAFQHPEAADQNMPDISRMKKFADAVHHNLDAKPAGNTAVEAAAQRREPSDSDGFSRPEGQSLRKLEKEFDDIKDSLRKLLETRGKDGDKRFNDESEEDLMIKPYFDILRSNEFDQEECKTIVEEIKDSMSRDDLRDKYKIEKTLRDLLKSRIITSGPIKRGNKKKILMFIGPTGVGKTTTMAKLGAIFSLREGYHVSFVTIDNYRIAATEQLKKYAEIMKIPIHVVNDQKTFKDVIDNDKSEIIMVDTSGRSHKNDLKISEIKSYADMVEYDFEKILCVSASTKKVDLANVFKSFDKVSFSSVIVTKVDETSCVGNVVDIADKYKKPISYFTNGQEVPNDIDIADPEKLVNMMIGSIK